MPCVVYESPLSSDISALTTKYTSFLMSHDDLVAPVIGNNNTERLKSALYLRLKKRKVFKTVKGGPFGFLKIQFFAKYQKIEGGTL